MMLMHDATIVNLNIQDTDNTGDLECLVTKHFPIKAKTGNLMDFQQFPTNADVIIGGGMLLKRINQYNILDHFAGIKIGWGLGHKTKESYADLPFIKQFDLLGVRDYGIGLEYVPCPSCMSTEFDNAPGPTQSCVYYQNIAYPLFPTNPLNKCMASPLLGNNRPLPEVIKYLASGETIISSSYHGVYWGMLLGRKVIAIPFNHKFDRFKYPVPLEKIDFITSSKIAKAPSFGGYLEECREINIKFAEKVKERLG